MESESTSDRLVARLRCPECARLVPLSLAPGAAEGRCPECARTIPLDRPVRLDEEDFQAAVLEADVPALVAFKAEWCAPCKWLDPYLEEVVASSAGRLLAFEVDVDDAPELARRYQIATVPTVLLFRSGSVEARSLGVEPAALREMASGIG